MPNNSQDLLTVNSFTIVGEISSGYAIANDYNLLTNQPTINNVALTGNLTLAELGIQAAGDYPTTLSYIYEQNIPTNSWTIEHNLNKYPSVVVVDSANSMVMGEITYIDENNLKIDFNGAFAGKAFVN